MEKKPDTKSFCEELGQKLEDARKNAGLTLREACQAGRPLKGPYYSAISKYERGQTSPNIEQLLILSLIYKVNLKDLIP